MFSELNKAVETVRDGINTQDMEFRPLKDFVGQEIKVDGFFFTEGKYGTQVVVVGNGVLINMPSRAVDVFEKIRSEKPLLDGVLEGHLKLTKIKPVETRNGSTTSYTLTDC